VKSPFPWLALIGTFLVGLAAYLQITSMDLSRFALSDYLVAGSAVPAWWHVIAVPFMLGLIYLVTALVCMRLRPSRSATFAVLIACLLFAAVLCFFDVWLGFSAAVFLVLLLVCAIPRGPSHPGKSHRGAA
jgi:hypothetical protein